MDGDPSAVGSEGGTAGPAQTSRHPQRRKPAPADVARSALFRARCSAKRQNAEQQNDRAKPASLRGLSRETISHAFRAVNPVALRRWTATSGRRLFAREFPGCCNYVLLPHRLMSSGRSLAGLVRSQLASTALPSRVSPAVSQPRNAASRFRRIEAYGRKRIGALGTRRGSRRCVSFR